MNKFTKKLLTGILFIFLFLSFFSSVLSQEENPPEITPPKEIQTLANENGINTICLKGENVQEHTIGMGKVGTQKFNLVSEKEAIAGLPLYVAICVTEEGQLKCTTTNSQTDMKIFGKDNTQMTFSVTTCKKRCNEGKTSAVTITKIPVFTVAEGNPYIPTSDKVNLSVTMSNIVVHASYPYYGFQIIPPATEMGGGGEAAKGHDATVQESTFSFEQQLSPEESEQKCIGVSWDPFGRVFDAKSLEPMEGIKVRILDSINPEHYPPVINTELYTNTDGVFNFMVPEGIYYLRLDNIPKTHKFIKNPSLNPNYTKIYVKPDGSSSIYTPDEPIKELIDTPEEKKAGKPFIEQRDIPLDPGTNQPYKAISVEEYENERGLIMIGAGDTAKMRYSGRVSHPFAKVDLVGKISNKVIASRKADRQGFFQIIINSDIVPVDEALEIKASPTDLTKDDFDSPISWIKKTFSMFVNFFIKNVSAVNNFYSYEPILRYIEGYAYDSSNKPIKNAEVTVKLSMNDASYYKTTADSKGYFVIASNHLPPFNFYLKLTDPKTRLTTTQTTSDFVQNNKKYLENKSIDLMKYKPDKENLLKNSKKNSDDNKKTISLNNTSGSFQNKNEKQIGNILQKNNFYKTVIFIIFMIIMLMIATVGMIIYINKKKSEV